MNCFEARQEFPALWRNRTTGERRAEILAHLKNCAKCDHAFRVFALTAPVLHSEAEPPAARVSSPARREFSLADRPRRFASVSREAASPRRWVAIAAAAAIFVIAGSAAVYSVDAPRETLSDALSMPDSNDNYQAAADPLAPEMPMSESDLAS
jgi:predicted anti-sigma-YlaC factor YlaD